MGRSVAHASVIGLLASLAVACGAEPRATPRAPDESQALPELFEEPYLPVRTEFTVVLEEALGTNVPSTAFRARSPHPVRSPDNEIVLPSGAVVRGRVVAIEHNPALGIKLKFDDVDTVWGHAPVGATIRSAEPYASCAPGMEGTAPYDASLRLPLSEPLVSSSGAIGGGPRPTGEFGAILLPKGAELRLVLVKPLVPPPRARSMR